MSFPYGWSHIWSWKYNVCENSFQMKWYIRNICSKIFVLFFRYQNPELKQKTKFSSNHSSVKTGPIPALVPWPFIKILTNWVSIWWAKYINCLFFLLVAQLKSLIWRTIECALWWFLFCRMFPWGLMLLHSLFTPFNQVIALSHDYK